MLTQTKQADVDGRYETASGEALVPAGEAGGSALMLAGGRDCTRTGQPSRAAPEPRGPVPGGPGQTPAPVAVDPAGHLGTAPLSSGSASTSVARVVRIGRRLAGLARCWSRWLVRTSATLDRRTGGLRAGLAHLFAGLQAWLSAAYAVWRVRAADQRGSQITDNLGLVVIGIVAIIAIGGLISGLDKTVFNWVTTQLGLSSGGSAG